MFRPKCVKGGKSMYIVMLGAPGSGKGSTAKILAKKIDLPHVSTGDIFREEIKKAGLDEEIWQYFTVLPGIRSVGVMGDGRTYDYAVAIRAVTSIDGMTADFAKIPWDVLQKISVRIVNEVDHVNRILYDVTSKPPSTIEYEQNYNVTQSWNCDIKTFQQP